MRSHGWVDRECELHYVPSVIAPPTSLLYRNSSALQPQEKPPYCRGGHSPSPLRNTCLRPHPEPTGKGDCTLHSLLWADSTRRKSGLKGRMMERPRSGSSCSCGHCPLPAQATQPRAWRHRLQRLWGSAASPRSDAPEWQEQGQGDEEREESGVSSSSLSPRLLGHALCALLSTVRQRNPRLSFLWLHSGVCLCIFLFKTTVVETNREQPRCNKLEPLINTASWAPKYTW